VGAVQEQRSALKVRNAGGGVIAGGCADPYRAPADPPTANAVRQRDAACLKAVPVKVAGAGG